MRAALVVLVVAGCGSRAATRPPQPPSNVAAPPASGSAAVAAVPAAAPVQSTADDTARNDALVRIVLPGMRLADCAAVAAALSSFVDAHRAEIDKIPN